MDYKTLLEKVAKGDATISQGMGGFTVSVPRPPQQEMITKKALKAEKKKLLARIDEINQVLALLTEAEG